MSIKKNNIEADLRIALRHIEDAVASIDQAMAALVKDNVIHYVKLWDVAIDLYAVREAVVDRLKPATAEDEGVEVL